MNSENIINIIGAFTLFFVFALSFRNDIECVRKVNTRLEHMTSISIKYYRWLYFIFGVILIAIVVL